MTTPNPSDGELEACVHEWKWHRDISGADDVINGTCDASYWECELCGEGDPNREPPSDDDFYDPVEWYDR